MTGVSKVEPLESRQLMAATNLVVNGNFSAGNTGFSTDLRLSSIVGTGNYTVGDDAFNFHPLAGSFKDHTTGTGRMLLVNGSTSPNAAVWRQSIRVTANTTYKFSAYLASWGNNGTGIDPSPANVNFSINGVTAVGKVLHAANGQWALFSGTWNSASATQAILTFTDLNTAGYGNDFAIDDITFATAATTTPTPTTPTPTTPTPTTPTPTTPTAPTTNLKRGVLNVYGTSGSDRIKIQFTQELVRPAGSLGAVFSRSYQVIVNGETVLNPISSAVRRINVYGGGGRDTIAGPTSFATVYTRTTSGTELSTGFPGEAYPVAPMYADGGSGSDRIYGGTADDTLVGGRGNDTLIDQYGANTLIGGEGIDTLNTLEGKARVLRFRRGVYTIQYRAVPGGTADRIFDDATRGGTIFFNSDDGLDVGGKVIAEPFATGELIGRLR